MKEKTMLAGVDAGHLRTKAVILRGGEILAYATTPTGLNAARAAQQALGQALDNAGKTQSELAGVITTGIFRDVLRGSPVKVTQAVPEHMADAKGALFLNKNSRTVIDIGGNIQKAIRYDANGNLLDVIQNDKCADGLGIFYSAMAKAMGLSEEAMSELALQSTQNLSLAIQCVLSAESDAIDLICRDMEPADIANAVLKFIVERVADMCAFMTLSQEIVVAGGLARSQALIRHLREYIKQDVNPLKLPEYAGAIGAVISYEGGK